MRVLVIHPEDELQDGPWVSRHWDRVIDLGRAGAESYVHAGESFGCPVTSFDAFRDNFNEKRKVRDLLALGMGSLTDAFGLDWWELTSIHIHQQLEIAFLLRLFVDTLDPHDEVHISRPCFHGDVLRWGLGARLQTYARQGNEPGRGAGHYLRVLKKFPAGQLLEIFWDKTDPGYQLRGSLGNWRTRLSDSVVLLPSAYINVSRTAIAYAESLPDVRFLLVATRRSGWIESPPPNVAVTWLRRYASVRVPARKIEFSDLVLRWRGLASELKMVPEFRILSELGCLDDFPIRFAQGLEIRDAWRNVLDSEPVQAALCADDTNPFTHIPLLLAVQKGLPTIACHHGALDGRYMFKRDHADILLAKGKMEQDYLVRVCGLLPEKIEVGAPILPAEAKQESGEDQRRLIVFFSEAYEVAGGRARGFYQDILPPLADLALSEGRQLIIKLHPSESFAERSRLAEEILRPEQRKVVRMVGGPLRAEMMKEAWFGVTVLSTVVTECALRGVPCFLCSWLESWPYGYVDQFTRFGMGIRLTGPSEIGQIPVTLKNYQASSTVQEDCWHPIEKTRLRALLGIGRESCGTSAVQGSGPEGS
jgi:hypothetical protein